MDKTAHFHPSPKTARILHLLIGVGLLTFVSGLVVAPDRIWSNFLLVAYYLLGAGIAGLVFIAFQYAAGAGWHVAFRRVPEAMTGAIPYAAVGIFTVIILNVIRPDMYPWVNGEHQAAYAHSFKGVWLNPLFFIVRAAIYFALWMLFSSRILKSSRAQDSDGDIQHTHKNIRRSAAFIVVFALTFWLSSFDWLMSLEPDWYSTIFAVYNFAGMFYSGIAVIILLSVWLKNKGALDGVLTEHHLHDLGKLLFGFSSFWMYIWFSQYMLIWYANIPEETTYFLARKEGMWEPLFYVNCLLNWAIPFFLLLPASHKKDATILKRVAVVALVGRWLDLYLMIAPARENAGVSIGVWEAGMVLGAVGLFGVAFFKSLSKASIVPIKDPFLEESIHRH